MAKKFSQLIDKMPAPAVKRALEKALGKSAEKKLLPLQAGDVPDTYADVADLVEKFHYQPTTSVEEGIQRFVAWYRKEFKLI